MERSSRKFVAPEPLEVLGRDLLMARHPTAPRCSGTGGWGGAGCNTGSVSGSTTGEPPCFAKQGTIRYTTGPELAGGSATGGGIGEPQTVDGLLFAAGRVAGLRERRGRGDRSQKRRAGERSSQLLLH